MRKATKNRRRGIDNLKAQITQNGLKMYKSDLIIKLKMYKSDLIIKLKMYKSDLIIKLKMYKSDLIITLRRGLSYY